tara:strand:+ start:249 stop:470 length:222 start_codon:yes stop_codon:yes gene_type:complete
VTIITEEGQPMKIRTADLDISPTGMNCRHEVNQDLFVNTLKDSRLYLKENNAFLLIDPSLTFSIGYFVKEVLK